VMLQERSDLQDERYPKGKRAPVRGMEFPPVRAEGDGSGGLLGKGWCGSASSFIEGMAAYKQTVLEGGAGLCKRWGAATAGGRAVRWGVV